MAHTIEAAKQSGLFERILVSSEDEEILSVAARFGADPYRRSADLAQGTTFVIDVVKDVVRGVGMDDDDVVVVLFPTCPLRTGEDISEAYQLFVDQGGTTSVVAVTEYDYPIQVSLRLDHAGRLEPVFDASYRASTRHDDQEKAYRANYSILINTAGSYCSQSNLIGDSPIPFFMPLERSIDIDLPYHFEIARLLLENKVSGGRAEG